MMANQQSQLYCPASTRGAPARLAALSDLRQRDLQRVGVTVDVEDEGVFVGVVLDDVVVHVHQDPGSRDFSRLWRRTHRPHSKQQFVPCILTHPFLLFL